MEFLLSILAKIELICQEPQVSGAQPSSGVPERMTGGWWGGLAMFIAEAFSWFWRLRKTHLLAYFVLLLVWQTTFVTWRSLMGHWDVAMRCVPSHGANWFGMHSNTVRSMWTHYQDTGVAHNQSHSGWPCYVTEAICKHQGLAFT